MIALLTLTGCSEVESLYDKLAPSAWVIPFYKTDIHWTPPRVFPKQRGALVEPPEARVRPLP
jgi:hypothetical protein